MADEKTVALYGYAFGDETGDAGLHLAHGSSDFFVAGLVLTNQPVELREFVAGFRQELRLQADEEFSFHRSPDRNRSLFLQGLLDYDLRIRALAVNKGVLSADLKRLSRADFYVWAFGDLLAHTLSEFEAATIVLDEFGDANQTVRALKRKLRDAPSGETLRRHIRRIAPRRSRSESLLQIADMTTGAIYRHVAHRDHRFYRLIESRTILSLV